MNENFQPAYIATIANVKETILLGTANLDFWRARLKRENLYPFNANCRAQIMISATQLKWMGLPSRELVISVTTCDHAEENSADAAYLIHAFNSSRMLAFAERVFFQTPYACWGNLESNAHVPASITLNNGNDIVFHAQMSDARACMRGENETMQGAIYLPKGATRNSSVFFAKLGGYTESYPFISGTDTLELKSSNPAPVFQALIESGFTPHEWRIRNNATHARSKTYSRV
jgi:hypothetical protein